MKNNSREITEHETQSTPRDTDNACNSEREKKKEEKDLEQKENEKLEEYGQLTLENNQGKRKIHLLSIIGEVEGHENLSGNAKATKYDHVLPKLASLEDDDSVDGLLVLLNKIGRAHV